ncbi:hypothetical protein SAMN05444671_3681 [Flavobacterium sp. CF108]|uniref:hypothetical protein n=1 Tax=unclassified Flavobacterium TaxID=196869 RepID=UPI0008C7A0F5|nr:MULTISPECIES: hypothetical protein [unclassified Flavobacterium]SEO52464.1 hypothetical protein SAMN04487978_3115 [Flavobacterium sp. fv08]SHH74208.1 hypothetical protein SAMN05444671_3681 [Flavobacterium sp. CF108]
MKIKVLLALLFCSAIGFSQSVNDYKAVIIPLKYDFIKTDNQYRLATLTKSNLLKAGFEAYYTSEQVPAGYDRCEILYIDVKRDNAFLVTKLFVQFKDCYGKVIYTSETGKSREKDYEVAYKESLEGAFVSIIGLHYKYNGKTISSTSSSVAQTAAPVAAVASTPVEKPVVNLSDPNLLYAQPTENGFQLIDKTPKVVMKLLKTSRADSFIAIKDGIQGSLNAKDNQWYFEYYQNDKLISEKVSVKF